jgi:hypothetical protein
MGSVACWTFQAFDGRCCSAQRRPLLASISFAWPRYAPRRFAPLRLAPRPDTLSRPSRLGCELPLRRDGIAWNQCDTRGLAPREIQHPLRWKETSAPHTPQSDRRRSDPVACKRGRRNIRQREHRQVASSVPVDDAEWLTAEARRLGLTVSAVIGLAVTRYRARA